MKFKGTIIITDPCYLGSGNKFLESIDHWYEETDLGEHLHKIGLTSYISESTLYGDWSCFTYKGTKEEALPKIKEWNTFYFNFITDKCNLDSDKVQSLYNEERETFVNNNTYGEFCADSGQVCVCYLEEVLKFNPNFKEWADSHKWCVTIIENFDGDVTYEHEDDSAHIIGVGNINFYTSQSGL